MACSRLTGSMAYTPSGRFAEGALHGYSIRPKGRMYDRSKSQTESREERGDHRRRDHARRVRLAVQPDRYGPGAAFAHEGVQRHRRPGAVGHHHIHARLGHHGANLGLLHRQVPHAQAVLPVHGPVRGGHRGVRRGSQLRHPDHRPRAAGRGRRHPYAARRHGAAAGVPR